MSHAPVFANPQVTPRGWYWALPSRELRPGDKRELKLFGKTILLYRSAAGVVKAVHAFCPHMGAHLGQGRVEGDHIRCGFHGWKFSGDGECLESTCSKDSLANRPIEPLTTYLVAEKFAMIWIHTDRTSTDPLPDFPSLDGAKVSAHIDVVETRHCHPTLILGGGVDEEHFRVVHRQTTKMVGPMRFAWERLSPAVIRFRNTAPLERRTWR